MRHRHKGRKLNRTRSHRKAMLRNMVTTFIELEQIETTDAKAKELRSLAERLVTLGKRGSEDPAAQLAARRQVLKVVRSKKAVAKLFDELGPRYADRPGGYTRIVKVENRRGDGAPLSILKFVTEPVTFKDMKHKRARLEEETTATAAPVVESAETEEAPEVVEEGAEAAEETEAAEAEQKTVEAAQEAEPEAKQEAAEAVEETEAEGKEEKPEESSEEQEPEAAEESAQEEGSTEAGDEPGEEAEKKEE